MPEELRQVSGRADWSTLVFENFTSNEHNWLVGNHSNEYFAQLNQTIADGRYHWEARLSRPNSLSTAWLTGYPVSDFHLLVNCKHIWGSRTGSSAGVVFRLQDNQNGYWFRITDHQHFAVSVVKHGQWLTIVDWTRTDTLKPYGVNQLEVIGYQTHWTFLLNGQIVSEVEDAHFSQGLVGVAIEGYVAGEETTFDFLDLLLRAP